MLANPLQLESISNLPAMARKLELPGMPGMGSESGSESIVCFTTGNGRNECFTNPGKNSIQCKDDSCFVSYTTSNQRLLGNGKRLGKLGMSVLLVPDGISTSVVITGKVPRTKLRTLGKIVGAKIAIDEVNELPGYSDGLPKPPASCHLNPVAKGCTSYLSSDDWLYLPAIGFKRRSDIMNDPKTAFKSEIMPELKKVGEMIKEKTVKRTG